MKFNIDFQNTVDDANVPDRFKLQRWVNTVLQAESDPADLCIRVVNIAEIQQLNLRYRQKDKPTNVLSFPADFPDDITLPTRYLGDIVICNEVVNLEAAEQGKSLEAHWAHMVMHGVLHLLGYDHIIPAEAELMESLEQKLMHQLGYPDPYLVTSEINHE